MPRMMTALESNDFMQKQERGYLDRLGEEFTKFSGIKPNAQGFTSHTNDQKDEWWIRIGLPEEKESEVDRLQKQFDLLDPTHPLKKMLPEDVNVVIKVKKPIDYGSMLFGSLGNG